MKRVIDYIKNLFGTDVRLRKWCAQMNQEWFVRADIKDAHDRAQALYDWVTRGERPE